MRMRGRMSRGRAARAWSGGGRHRPWWSPPAGWQPTLRRAQTLVEMLLLALLVFLAERAVVENVRIHGESMAPTYQPGQYVLVNKARYRLGHGPARGDVVVVQRPPSAGDARLLFKRVIGLPGEHVQLQDGWVLIQGQVLQEPYVRTGATDCAAADNAWCDVWLGVDEYFVLGDNRPNSRDSREWGPLLGRQLIGKAWLTYRPPAAGLAPHQRPRLHNARAPAPPQAAGFDPDRFVVIDRSLVGTWVVTDYRDEVRPDQLFPMDIAGRTITFAREGTYCVATREHGGTADACGRYSFLGPTRIRFEQPAPPGGAIVSEISIAGDELWLRVPGTMTITLRRTGS